MAVKNLKLAQSKFIIVYTVAVVLCFSPFKAFSLVSPVLIILLMIFFVGVKAHYNIIKLFLFSAIYIAIGIVYFLVNGDFLWRNYLFLVLTHCPYLILLLSFKELIDRRMLQRIASVTIKILFFEAIFGIAQVLYRVIVISHQFDGNTGDSAMGTVNPAFGVGDGLASNVYYAIGLSGLAVLAAGSRLFDKRRITTTPFLLVLLAWVFASVMHSLFLLMAAIFITCFVLIFFMPKKQISFFNKQLKAIKSIIGISIVITLCLLLFLPSNVELLRNYYEQTFDPAKMQSSKSIATLETINELAGEKPYQPFIGLGGGQYTSRASLILSDEYLSSSIPDFLKSVSPDLEKHILPIWREYKSATFQAGSTYFPFYSWLTLYTEWGLLGCSVVGFFIYSIFRRSISLVSQENFYLIIALLVIVFYIFLLGVQDNYWEWTQFILPIVLYAKSTYLMAMKTATRKSSPSEAKSTDVIT